MSKFKMFYKGLCKRDRQLLADKAGTSVKYIEVHLLGSARVPRRAMMLALIQASNEISEGTISKADVLDHFYHERKTVRTRCVA